MPTITTTTTEHEAIRAFLRPSPDTPARAYTEMYLQANPDRTRYFSGTKRRAADDQKKEMRWWDLYDIFDNWAKKGMAPTKGMLRGIHNIRDEPYHSP